MPLIKRCDRWRDVGAVGCPPVGDRPLKLDQSATALSRYKPGISSQKRVSSTGECFVQHPVRFGNAGDSGTRSGQCDELARTAADTDDGMTRREDAGTDPDTHADRGENACLVQSPDQNSPTAAAAAAAVASLPSTTGRPSVCRSTRPTVPEGAAATAVG